MANPSKCPWFGSKGACNVPHSGRAFCGNNACLLAVIPPPEETVKNTETISLILDHMENRINNEAHCMYKESVIRLIKLSIEQIREAL